MSLLRSVVALLAGVLGGGLVVGAIEMISSLFHPLPEGLDPMDRKAMAEHARSLPVTAFAMVLVAWCGGCFSAGFLARRLAPQRSMAPAAVACLILVAMILAMLIMIPSPLWLWATGLTGGVLCGLLGTAWGGPAIHELSTGSTIHAPNDLVFRTLANPRMFAQAVPEIEQIDFLTGQQEGPGTRFRETRIMNGHKVASELSITEQVDGQRLRIDSIAGGASWSTLFELSPAGANTRVEMSTTARPLGVMGRLLVPLILGLIRKALAKDLDAIRQFCEQTARQ